MSITRTVSKCCCGAEIETPSSSELREWHVLHTGCLAPKAPALLPPVIPNHTEIRRKLWRDVAIGVATSSNSKLTGSMSTWADFALAEFDKRFKEY
jgi:hypothetical protein